HLQLQRERRDRQQAHHAGNFLLARDNMPVIARGCALFLLLLLSWPAARAQIIATLDNPATRGADIAVNERTNRVYIASGTESVVEVIDGATSSVVARVPIGSTPKYIAVNATT